MKTLNSLLLACAVVFACRDASAQTATTKPIGLLNVQGVLHENGQPVNGFMWFCFDWFTTPTGGTSLAHDTNMNQVMVSNGVANVLLNIGDLSALRLSPTQEYYLQLDVSRTGEPGSFTVLNPRQRIVPSVFASMAVRAEEARRLIEPLDVNLLPPTVPRLDGSPTFLGTLTTRGNLSAARLEVGTGHLLSGAAASIAGGTSNTNRANAAAIGGGAANTIGAGGSFAAVGGGSDNLIQSSYCFIGGGQGNRIYTDSDYSTIGGGDHNDIGDHSAQSTIGGGTDNDIADSAPDSTISGGTGNDIGLLAQKATIAGGEANVVKQSYGTIGGGSGNSVDITPYGTIPGGRDARTLYYGQMAYSSGKFANAGDAQSSVFVLRGVSPANSTSGETELFLDGTGERMGVPGPGAWMFDILLVGYSSGGSAFGYRLVGVIKNSGTTTLAGTPTQTSFGDPIGIGGARIDANNVDQSLRIYVARRFAEDSTRWVATVRTAEVWFPSN